MDTFLNFMEICKNKINYSGQNLKTSFENNWLPLLTEFRLTGKLSSKNRESNIELLGINYYNLSNEEAFFILIHTGSYSSWINQPLRTGEGLDCKCKRKYAIELCKSLNKLPCHNNEIVFRMDSPDGSKDEVVSWFKRNIKKTISIPYFLSTSKENWKSTDIIWRIKTRNENSNAKDLAYITNNKTEREVLFTWDTFFEINRVNEIDGIIDLNKTNENSSAINLTGQYFKSI